MLPPMECEWTITRKPLNSCMRYLGITYLTEGTHTFTLKNGASFIVYASPKTPSQYGPQYGFHAFQYASREDRYNPSKGSSGIPITPPYATNASTSSSTTPDFPNVNIVMTHGPPKYILDRAGDRSSAGCEHLRRAVCRAKPQLHCFGHIHGSYGAQRVAWKSSTAKEELEDICIEAKEAYDDDMIPLPQVEPEGRMKNSSRKRGFARISNTSQEAVVHGKQTLLINAAVKAGDDELPNAPWLVDLKLPCRALRPRDRSSKVESKVEEDMYVKDSSKGQIASQRQPCKRKRDDETDIFPA